MARPTVRGSTGRALLAPAAALPLFGRRFWGFLAAALALSPAQASRQTRVSTRARPKNASKTSKPNNSRAPAPFAAAAVRPAGGQGGYQAAVRAAPGFMSAVLVPIPPDRLATAYQPYLGKKVSQADLAAIAARGQRPLPRRRFSPQPGDRPAAGHQGRPASAPGDRRQRRGSVAEGRGRRAVRHPADARCRSLASGRRG